MSAKKTTTPKKKIKKGPTAKRGGGGSKLARTEIVQVRLDPKLRIAADLAARTQRRTLSSFIEWSVAESVAKTKVGHDENETADFVANKIWDLSELQRFINLKRNCPHLLTYEEESLWNLLVSTQAIWATDLDLNCNLEGDNLPSLSILNELFGKFKDCAKGNISKEELVELIQTAIKNLPDDFIETFYKAYLGR